MDITPDDYDLNADFLWSIRADMPHRVKDCIERGADPNHHPTGELHPLMLSCARSSTAMTNELIQAGSDPNMMFDGVDEEKAMEVFIVCLENVNTFGFLLLTQHWPKNFQDWDSPWVNGQHPLHAIAKKATSGQLLLLTTVGVDINLPDEEGQTLAHKISTGLISSAAKLGLRFDTPDKKKRTPFWMAMGAGTVDKKIDITKITTLLELGVSPSLDPNVRYIYARAKTYFIDQGYYLGHDIQQNVMSMVLEACRPWALRTQLTELAQKSGAPVKPKSNTPKM